jgi:hypothetical protein
MTEGKDVPVPPPAELVISYIHEVLAPQSSRNSMKSASQNPFFAGFGEPWGKARIASEDHWHAPPQGRSCSKH